MVSEALDLQRPRARRALVAGRFDPLHDGHGYLLDVARASAHEVHVALDASVDRAARDVLRRAWIVEACPGALVHLVQDGALPPVTPDLVVSADGAQARLAAQLGARFLPVARWQGIDSDRVRRDPLEAWAHLPSAVRAHYARRVAVLGPESTGKTTLARALAAHYQTTWVPEYLRAWIDHKGMPVVPEDVHAAAAGQIATEAALARRCTRLLVCDTDLWMNVVYAEYYYGAAPGWIVEAARAQTRALTLVLEPDVPHVPDVQREGPHVRAAILDKLVARLTREGVSFHRIGGTWEARFAAATARIDPLLTF